MDGLYYPGKELLEEAAYLREIIERYTIYMPQTTYSYYSPGGNLTEYYGFSSFWPLLPEWNANDNYQEMQAVRYNDTIYRRYTDSSVIDHNPPDVATNIWFPVFGTNWQEYDSSKAYNLHDKVYDTDEFGWPYFVSKKNNNTSPLYDTNSWWFPGTMEYDPDIGRLRFSNDHLYTYKSRFYGYQL